MRAYKRRKTLHLLLCINTAYTASCLRPCSFVSKPSAFSTLVLLFSLFLPPSTQAAAPQQPPKQPPTTSYAQPISPAGVLPSTSHSAPDTYSHLDPKSTQQPPIYNGEYSTPRAVAEGEYNRLQTDRVQWQDKPAYESPRSQPSTGHHSNGSIRSVHQDPTYGESQHYSSGSPRPQGALPRPFNLTYILDPVKNPGPPLPGRGFQARKDALPQLRADKKSTENEAKKQEKLRADLEKKTAKAEAKAIKAENEFLKKMGVQNPEKLTSEERPNKLAEVRQKLELKTQIAEATTQTKASLKDARAVAPKDLKALAEPAVRSAREAKTLSKEGLQELQRLNQKAEAARGSHTQLNEQFQEQKRTAAKAELKAAQASFDKAQNKATDLREAKQHREFLENQRKTSSSVKIEKEKELKANKATIAEQEAALKKAEKRLNETTETRTKAQEAYRNAKTAHNRATTSMNATATKGPALSQPLTQSTQATFEKAEDFRRAADKAVNEATLNKTTAEKKLESSRTKLTHSTESTRSAQAAHESVNRFSEKKLTAMQTKETAAQTRLQAAQAQYEQVKPRTAGPSFYNSMYEAAQTSTGTSRGVSNPMYGTGPPPPPPPPATAGVSPGGAAPAVGSGTGAGAGYTNSTTVAPTSRDNCAYSATIDRRYGCANATNLMSTANNYSMMSMMIGGMMTSSMGAGHVGAAQSSQDQSEILRQTAATQMAGATTGLAVAAGNIYYTVALSREATKMKANAAQFEAAAKGPVTTDTVTAGQTAVSGALMAGQGGFASSGNAIAQQAITNFNLNSNVTMTGTDSPDANTQAAQIAARQGEATAHQAKVQEQLGTITTEAAAEQTTTAQQVSAAKLMPMMMAATQMLTATSSMTSAGMLLKQASDLASKKTASGPLVVVDSGSGTSNGSATGPERTPSAITGAAESQDPNSQDGNVADAVPPPDAGTPFAPSPTGGDIAGNVPQPDANATGAGNGDNGAAGDGGGAGLSASTSPASAVDEPSKDPQLADVPTDQTNYAASGGGGAGGGGGGDSSGNLDLNSLLGQLLPKQDEDQAQNSDGILSFGKSDGMHAYSPLGVEVNIFTKISEKYSELNKSGAI